jgi:hypothetical protein
MACLAAGDGLSRRRRWPVSPQAIVRLATTWWPSLRDGRAPRGRAIPRKLGRCSSVPAAQTVSSRRAGTCGPNGMQVPRRRTARPYATMAVTPACAPRTSLIPQNPPQRRFNDHSVREMFPTQYMSLPLLPKLSNWSVSRHCHRAQGDRKLLELRRREDSSRNRSALYPFRWNTWQQNTHPRTCCPCTVDTPGNGFLPSKHKPRSKHHIARQSLDSSRDPFPCSDSVPGGQAARAWLA